MQKIAYLSLVACLVAVSGLMTGCETTPIEALGGEDVGIGRHAVVSNFQGNPEFEVVAVDQGARRDESYYHESGAFELHLYGSRTSLTMLEMVVTDLPESNPSAAKVKISLPRKLFPSISTFPEALYDAYAEVAFGPAGRTKTVTLEQRDYVFEKTTSGETILTMTRVSTPF